MTSKDEYGFVTYVSNDQDTKRTNAKKPEWVVVGPPDPRRFAIALSGSCLFGNLTHHSFHV